MLIKHLHSLGTFMVRHWRRSAVLGVILALLPIGVLAACTLAVSRYQSYILPPAKVPHTRVGLVLGAGITTTGKPYKELQARLDSAAEALARGQVDKLILSGDNRFKSYDEPTAMKNYLVNIKHVPADKLQPDYAGRDTYDSCKRAAQIFGLKQTVIFSAGSHLPRAIFLCDHLGVKAIGISSGVDGANAWRREPLATVKAVLDICIPRHKTVLGPPIRV